MMALSQESIDAIAERVVELLREEGLVSRPSEWVDAGEIARRFDVSRDFVYRQANDLGVVRMGGRLRFDPAEVAERMRPKGPEPPPARRRRRQKAQTRSGAPLLQIRGERPR